MDAPSTSETPSVHEEIPEQDAALEELSKDRPEFKSLAEATDAYVELEASSENLLDDAQARIEELETALTEKKSEIESLKGDLESKLEDATNHSAELADQIKSLETELAELREKDMDADRRSAAIAASVGIEPVESSPDSPSQNKEASREEFDAMSHDERHAFFKAGGVLKF